jgi:hypothetical protein
MLKRCYCFSDLCGRGMNHVGNLCSSPFQCCPPQRRNNLAQCQFNVWHSYFNSVSCLFEYQRLRQLFHYFHDHQIPYSRSATVITLLTLHPPPYSHYYHHHHCLCYHHYIYYLTHFTCQTNVKLSRYASELLLSPLNIKRTIQQLENFPMEKQSNLLANLSDDRKITIQISDTLHITRPQNNYTLL